jgi:hypothetical protein
MNTIINRIIIAMLLSLLSVGHDADMRAQIHQPITVVATMPNTVVPLPPYPTPTRGIPTPQIFPPPTFTTATLPATIVPFPDGRIIYSVYLPAIKCDDLITNIQR